MNVASLSFTLDERDAVSVWVSRSAGWACLVIDAPDTYSEIRMDREHVETLHDQLTSALAGMDQWDAEDIACEKAETAQREAVDVATRALELAVAADQAGAHEQAASLRGAAAEATAKATAVTTQVRAFQDATTEADHTTEKLLFAMSQAGAVLRTHRDGDRPAEQMSGVGR